MSEGVVNLRPSHRQTSEEYLPTTKRRDRRRFATSATCRTKGCCAVPRPGPSTGSCPRKLVCRVLRYLVSASLSSLNCAPGLTGLCCWTLLPSFAASENILAASLREFPRTKNLTPRSRHSQASAACAPRHRARSSAHESLPRVPQRRVHKR